MGRLYLCATPLGNLDDITLRALEVLKEVDLVAAEDTRHTRKLLDHYGITTKTTSYHQHNERGKASSLLAELEKGKEIALVSDAGTPGVSDPGYILVQQALEAGHEVTVLPGPSAVIAALVISGFKPYPFYFFGFLPRKKGSGSNCSKSKRKIPGQVFIMRHPTAFRKHCRIFAISGVRKEE